MSITQGSSLVQYLLSVAGPESSFICSALVQGGNVLPAFSHVSAHFPLSLLLPLLLLNAFSVPLSPLPLCISLFSFLPPPP